jgi:hypothetical protein
MFVEKSGKQVLLLRLMTLHLAIMDVPTGGVGGILLNAVSLQG